MGFIKSEDDSQNVGWDYAKRKYYKMKLKFPTQPRMILVSCYVLFMLAYLCVYLGIYLCYGIPKGDFGVYKKPY